MPTRDEDAPFGCAPSDEEQSELIAAQQFVIDQLTSQGAGLQPMVADLSEGLGRMARNSSMPPSAEGFSKPPSRA